MDDYKATLLTLGDDEFFELIRNYLGPVKTPFNKHDLIAQLLAFLKKDDIQERIVSLIDEADAEVLTAVWLLGEPTHEDLFALLEMGHSFLDLHNHLLNLEDRLLIYRDAEHVRLNPELEPRIVDGIVHPSRLFGTARKRSSRHRGQEKPAGSQCWIDEPLLISFFSYLMEEPELYRADGALRKRAADSIARRIPELSKRMSADDEPEVLRVDFLTEALLGLGLIVEDQTHVRPDSRAWHRWARLPRLNRLAEVAGAGAASGDGERRDAVLAAQAIISSLPTGLALDSTGLARLASAATGVPTETALKSVRSMENLGLLARSAESLSRAWQGDGPGETKPLVIQANFELTLPAETGFSDALFVAQVSELRRHDRYTRFELTKARVAAAMRTGLGASHIADRLAELAEERLPQNVATSIRTWEDEFESIRLYRGVVLQVRESRRYAVDHSAAIGELLVQELAPGTYLVDEADVGALQAGLREAGVELIPELPPVDPAGIQSLQALGPDAEMVDRIARITRIVSDSADRAPEPLESSRTLRLDMEAVLKKLSLPPEQRQELAQRIERKLIFSTNQIKSGALKSEKTEAKGLDYSGKVRIIEQSLSSGGYLEVIERTADGGPRRLLVEPESLRKEGTELILEASELPLRGRVALPVSKLGLVRRLRATLFRREPTD